MWPQGALQGTQQNLPQALIVSIPTPNLPQKTFLFQPWPRLDQVGVGGAGESPALLLEPSRGGKKSSAPPPFVDTHTQGHSPTFKNTQNAEDRAPPRVGTLRPFSWLEQLGKKVLLLELLCTHRSVLYMPRGHGYKGLHIPCLSSIHLSACPHHSVSTTHSATPGCNLCPGLSPQWTCPARCIQSSQDIYLGNLRRRGEQSHPWKQAVHCTTD